MISALSLRKPANFSIRARCKSSTRFDKGLSRIDNSLDVVSFIRQQMSQLVMKRLLFTNLENFMIARQQKPFVLRENQSSTDTDSLGEEDFLN